MVFSFFILWKKESGWGYIGVYGSVRFCCYCAEIGWYYECECLFAWIRFWGHGWKVGFLLLLHLSLVLNVFLTGWYVFCLLKSTISMYIRVGFRYFYSWEFIYLVYLDSFICCYYVVIYWFRLCLDWKMSSGIYLLELTLGFSSLLSWLDWTY